MALPTDKRSCWLGLIKTINWRTKLCIMFSPSRFHRHIFRYMHSSFWIVRRKIFPNPCVGNLCRRTIPVHFLWFIHEHVLNLFFDTISNTCSIALLEFVLYAAQVSSSGIFDGDSDEKRTNLINLNLTEHFWFFACVSKLFLIVVFVLVPEQGLSE